MNPISSRFTSTSLLSIPNTRFVISAAMASSSSSSSVSPSSLKSPKEEEEEEEKKLRSVIKYHNQTKHSFTGYARGPRGLNWANQPNPFRCFLSTPLLPLQRINDNDLEDSPLYSIRFLRLNQSHSQPFSRSLRVENHRLIHLASPHQPWQRKFASHRSLPHCSTHRFTLPISFRRSLCSDYHI